MRDCSFLVQGPVYVVDFEGFVEYSSFHLHIIGVSFIYKKSEAPVSANAVSSAFNDPFRFWILILRYIVFRLNSAKKTWWITNRIGGDAGAPPTEKKEGLHRLHLRRQTFLDIVGSVDLGESSDLLGEISGSGRSCARSISGLIAGSGCVRAVLSTSLLEVGVIVISCSMTGFSTGEALALLHSFVSFFGR